MHVEDLVARAEVSYDVEDFLPGILQHLRNRSLAEVQTVIRILLDRNELLQTIHSSQHPCHPLVTLGRHSRIVRVASNPDLVFRGYRYDAFKKIRNPLPGCVRVHRTGASERRGWVRILQAPGAVRSVAPAGSAASAQHTQDAHIVFDGWNPGSRTGADHILKGLDVAIALRALSQHDRRMFFTIDMAGREKWRCDAIHANAIFSGQIAQALKFIHRGIKTAIRNLRIATDIPN